MMNNGYEETMWAIHGKHGLYYGTYPTRKGAIDAHVKAYAGTLANRRRNWMIRKAKGDKCVKVTMLYTA